MLQSIDQSQRLYILKYDYGVSCLGFDVCQRISTFLANELGEIVSLYGKGTKEAFEEYERLLSLGKAKHEKTGWKSQAELTRQLTPFYGYKVEIVDCNNEKRKFIVGKSGGWMPCHIELQNVNSKSGPAVYGAPFKSVKTISQVKKGWVESGMWSSVA